MDAATREAEFDYWLHERGYRYIGDTSLYLLSVPEMSRLYRGWRSIEDRKEEAQAQAENPAGAHGTRFGSRFDNPHRRAEGQPRPSDFQKLHELEQQRKEQRDQDQEQTE